jgi:hypothetical protein
LLGGGPDRGVGVGVHGGDDLAGRAGAGGQGRTHLVEAFPAVRDVVVDDTRGVAEQRPVSWQQHPQACVIGERPQLIERPQVVAE